MKMAEKFLVLTLLQKGDSDSVIAVAKDIGVSRDLIFSIIKVSCVVTTRGDTEEEVMLWRT